MRLIFLFLFVILGQATFCQPTEPSPTEVIKEFFAAFHQKDTISMRSFIYEGANLRSISQNKEGQVFVEESSFSTFFKSIKSIPHEITFEERILDYQVKQNALLSNVWTPYEFYLNNQLSHCGVNNFQLLATKTGWKILSIVDTRKKDCKN